jgi:uncharacterized damage-inducible protein DinB
MSVPRFDPEPASDERTTLTEFLDFQRATIELKAHGLDDVQARTRISPSDISLIGIVRHLTDVERNWFRAVFRGEDAPPYFWSADGADTDWSPAAGDTLADALAGYRAECARSREITSAAALDEVSQVGVRSYGGRPVNLRWILTHMIEETARHAGHADLLRECIDGMTGE